MKERPILFSAPMVKALLEGRKTQTRRIVKPQPRIFTPEYDRQWHVNAIPPGGGLPELWSWWEGPAHGQTCYHTAKCPYGVPGDELWVRETWMEVSDPDTLKPSGRVIYRATHEGREPIRCDGDGFQVWNKDNSAASAWKPSIHMPRWASRISLVVKSVRVERLQDISEEDALAEGVPTQTSSYRRQFAYLWDSINGDTGPNSWIGNPWVWVIEFEVKPAATQPTATRHENLSPESQAANLQADKLIKDPKNNGFGEPKGGEE